MNAGTDANQATAGGVTPLYIAAQAGRRPHCIRILAEAGARPSLLSESGLTVRLEPAVRVRALAPEPELAPRIHSDSAGNRARPPPAASLRREF